MGSWGKRENGVNWRGEATGVVRMRPVGRSLATDVVQRGADERCFGGD